MKEVDTQFKIIDISISIGFMFEHFDFIINSFNKACCY